MFNINKTVDKVLVGDKNEVYRNIIKRFLNASALIIIILLIVLLCSILGVEFKYGFLDRDVLIAVVPTILGGYLGFLGSIVGIMGAFFMYQYQKDKEEESKKQIACKTLYEMINNSIQRTQELTEKIIHRYDHLIKQNNISKLAGDIREDFKFIYTNNFQITVEGLGYEECKHIQRFKDEVKIMFQNEQFSYLIYNENWYNHLEKFNENFVAEVSEWVNILLSNKYNDNAYEFLENRDLMILNIEEMSKENLIKVHGVSRMVSGRVHGYENIYKKINNN